MGDIHVLVRSLRGYSRNDELVKAVKAELRQPVAPVRKRIKGQAVAILPHAGGLGSWVAASKITATIQASGKVVLVRLRGGRRSTGAQSDIRAIDRGRVRAPSWGRRKRGDWHTQSVPDGFFTRTAEEAPEWAAAIDRAIVRSLETIHA